MLGRFFGTDKLDLSFFFTITTAFGSIQSVLIFDKKCFLGESKENRDKKTEAMVR